MTGLDLCLLVGVGALSFTQGCNGQGRHPGPAARCHARTGAGTYRALNDKARQRQCRPGARGASGMALDSAIRRTPLSGQSLG